MSSPSIYQKSALSILDFIFFHDLLNYSSQHPDKIHYFSIIGKCINGIVSKKKLNSRDALFYKHTLLCAFEILLSTEQQLSIEKYFVLLKNSLENQIGGHNSKIDIHQFDEDLNHLKNLKNFIQSGKRHEFGHKFVSYFLYFDFSFLDYYSSTLTVLKNLLKKNIIDLGRYQDHKCQHMTPLDESLFFRALLLVEFEVFKRYHIYNDFREDFLFSTNCDPADLDRTQKYLEIIKSFKSMDYDNTQSIYQVDLYSKSCVEKYLINLSSNLNHKNLFFKNKSNITTYCSGLLANYVISRHKSKDTTSEITKIKNSDCNKKQNEDKSKSATYASQTVLNRYGITISEETIYNNYRITKDFYSLIKQITKLMLDQGSQDVFREDIILLIFSHPSPPEIFLNLRNEALSHIVNLNKNS